MNGTTTTISGNAVADPELRFTPQGTPVANFAVACSERVYDRDQRTWTDGHVSFVPVTVWRGLAENAAESIRKGQRVVVTGRLQQKSWETRDGNRASRLEMMADDIGCSLMFGTATFAKTTGSGRARQEAENADQWGVPDDDEVPF